MKSAVLAILAVVGLTLSATGAYLVNCEGCGPKGCCAPLSERR